jgi:hypothetical protein
MYDCTGILSRWPSRATHAAMYRTLGTASTVDSPRCPWLPGRAVFGPSVLASRVLYSRCLTVGALAVVEETGDGGGPEPELLP